MGSTCLGTYNHGQVRIVRQWAPQTNYGNVIVLPHRMADMVAVVVVGMAMNGMAVR